ncbi:MAG: hypothetical protein M3Y31_10865, partial [Gemmatimonadota bacterium]|nr:hypothetical protein [Gemmatimonadota bacterium]
QERVIDAQSGTLRGVSKAQPAQQPQAPTSRDDFAAARAETAARVGPYAPTEKQVAFFQRLADSPVFTEDERRRALEWLATKATRQTIKDQIDWLKRQVETRKTPGTGQTAA